MPKDTRGKEVEGYKISPEMQSILKRYKRLKRVEGMLKYETAVESKKFADLREMWQSLQAEAAELGAQMPREPLSELEGMEFDRPTKEQMQIRY